LIDSDFLKESSQGEDSNISHSLSSSDSKSGSDEYSQQLDDDDHEKKSDHTQNEYEPSYLKSFLLFNRSVIVKRNSMSNIELYENSETRLKKLKRSKSVDSLGTM
jgi:hypothetical protein